MNELQRNCPECKTTLCYNNKYRCKEAETRHRLCKSCSKKGDRNWVHRNGGLRQHTIDKLKKICGGKNHSNYKKRLSEETKSRISNSHKKENLTYEQIVNYRKGAVKRIEKQRLLSGGNIGKNYNPIACEFFNRLNLEHGWNGIHALNKGEKIVYELGYFLDYYEPNKNIVIEWDENYHRREKQKEKDQLKQKEVTKLLGCKFYRIKQYDMDFDLIQKVKQNGNYHVKEVINFDTCT